MDIVYKKIWIAYFRDSEPKEIDLLLEDINIEFWARINIIRKGYKVRYLYLEFKYPMSRIDFELVYKFNLDNLIDFESVSWSRENMLLIFRRFVNDDITKIEMKYPYFLL